MLAVFLFMAIAALSPPAMSAYYEWCMDSVSPALRLLVDDSTPERVLGALELILVALVYGVPQVAMALVNKGVALAEAGRAGDAVSACEKVVRRYGDLLDPAIAALVADALFHKEAFEQERERPGRAGARRDIARRFSLQGRHCPKKWVG